MVVLDFCLNIAIFGYELRCCWDFVGFNCFVYCGGFAQSLTNMWIKWKYCDHGWPDFKEIEIPDDLDGWEDVEEYLCKQRNLHIPTQSVRFDSCRIQWEKVTKTHAEMQVIYQKKINGLRDSIKLKHKQIGELEKLLD